MGVCWEHFGSTAACCTALNGVELHPTALYCLYVFAGQCACGGQGGSSVVLHTEEVTGSIQYRPPRSEASSIDRCRRRPLHDLLHPNSPSSDDRDQEQSVKNKTG